MSLIESDKVQELSDRLPGLTPSSSSAPTVRTSSSVLYDTL